MKVAGTAKLTGCGVGLPEQVLRYSGVYSNASHRNLPLQVPGHGRSGLLIVGMLVSMFAVPSCTPAEEAVFRDSLPAEAEESAVTGSPYLIENSLVRPADYREWPFIGSGLGLTYDEETRSPDTPPSFTNVFVNPAAHRGFMDTGIWPNESIFVLEFRRSETDAAPNNGGRFQGDLLALEAEVKDDRFQDGWGFFNFGRASDLLDVAEPLSAEAAAPCVQCHTEHTAVERTFVQFYPTLLEVARREGTVKPGF